MKKLALWLVQPTFSWLAFVVCIVVIPALPPPTSVAVALLSMCFLVFLGLVLAVVEHLLTKWSKS